MTSLRTGPNRGMSKFIRVVKTRFKVPMALVYKRGRKRAILVSNKMRGTRCMKVRTTVRLTSRLSPGGVTKGVVIVHLVGQAKFRRHAVDLACRSKGGLGEIFPKGPGNALDSEVTCAIIARFFPGTSCCISLRYNSKFRKLMSCMCYAKTTTPRMTTGDHRVTRVTRMSCLMASVCKANKTCGCTKDVKVPDVLLRHKRDSH